MSKYMCDKNKNWMDDAVHTPRVSYKWNKSKIGEDNNHRSGNKNGEGKQISDGKLLFYFPSK